MQKCRVLVVDDNAEFRDSLIDLLNGQDYEAYRALDGVDALVKTLSGCPDIVIWTLPKTDRWDFDYLTHIKCVQPNVRVIECEDENLGLRHYDTSADQVFSQGQWTGVRLLACIEELKDSRLRA